MTTQLIDPNAAVKIEAAKEKLRAGSWGGTETVCMMSAMVSGAKSTEDCVTAGWPIWLAEVNVHLFDMDVRADDENVARYQFALDVANAVQEPRDYDKARDLFLIARLDTGEHSALKSLSKLEGDWTQQREAVEVVVALLRRKIAGEDVAEEMKAARAAAYTAGDAARAAAYTTAYTAAAAAYTAADTAYAAADVAADTAYTAARAAAYDAARADLIAALRNS